MTECSSRTEPGRRWPVHGWIGVVLVALFWTLNWSLSGPRAHFAFFGLWLGYSLAVDALVVWRKGSSMATRAPWRYVGLFFISVPAWWLFELFNLRTQNWYYAGREHFTDQLYFLLASLSFSTVMPAVFGSAELVGTSGWLKRIGRGWVLGPTRRTLTRFFVGGVLMLALLLVWPTIFYPLLWLSVFLILEPINAWLGNRTLLSHTARGDWRPVFSLWAGCLICAFFWEMWNYYSYPKWKYDTPFVNFWHVFEMPLLGYTGYLPFSMELFALYQLVRGIGGSREREDVVEISPD
jgi:hypothetical protein